MATKLIVLLRKGWQTFESGGERAWDHIKGAVHDAWDRVARR